MSASIVLAASDSQVIKAISDIVGQRDYTILQENSKTSALLKILDTNNVEMLIIDLDMSPQSGLDFIKIIRRTRPRLPIIVLAEDPEISVLQQIMNLGVYYWTFKPVITREINKFMDAIEIVRKKATFDFS